MAKIKPFKALVYNQEKITDLSNVVCPPYDIISSSTQDYYYSLSPYNFIHVLLTRQQGKRDKYLLAANYFNEWQKEKILLTEEEPAIYFYAQHYQILREKKTRLGFISLLHLSDKNSKVFGHEHTRLEPKEDRLRLLKEVKANLSPIFVVFMDKKRIINHAYQHCLSKEKPFIEVTDKEGVIHVLWRLKDKELLERMQERMKEEDIFIADGHHRYEVAQAYREIVAKEMSDKFNQEHPVNYILSYCTNTDPLRLTIFPVHRLLWLEQGFDLNKFIAQVWDYFEVIQVADKPRLFFLMSKSGRAEHVIGVYKDKKYWLLRLKNVKILDKLMSDKPAVYRSLDVSILNSIIFNGILGIDVEDKERIKFGPDSDAFIKEADEDERLMVFFLNPVEIRQVISIAQQGERMPSKSTYFYPKVLSGLVVNKLSEDISYGE